MRLIVVGLHEAYTGLMLFVGVTGYVHNFLRPMSWLQSHVAPCLCPCTRVMCPELENTETKQGV